MGVVVLVLLIACANVAGLLLARTTGRQRRLPCVSVIGASRWHVVRQLLVENLVLSAAGCAPDCSFARWAAGMLTHSCRAHPPLSFAASVI